MTGTVRLVAEVFAAALVAGLALLALGYALSAPLIEGARAVLDDSADIPFSEPHEAHIREAIAVANDEPDPDFLTRTRRVVVDELAQRRAGAR